MTIKRPLDLEHQQQCWKLPRLAPPARTWISLPNDVIGHVLMYLELKDLASVMNVSKGMESIINRDMESINDTWHPRKCTFVMGRVLFRHAATVILPHTAAFKGGATIRRFQALQDLRAQIMCTGFVMDNARLCTFPTNIQSMVLSISPTYAQDEAIQIQGVFDTIGASSLLRYLDLTFTHKSFNRTHWSGIRVDQLSRLSRLDHLRLDCNEPEEVYEDESTTAERDPLTLSDHQVAAFRSITTLEYLELFPSRITDASVSQLTATPHQFNRLETFAFPYRSDMSEFMMCALARIHTITELDVDIRSRSVAFLESLPALQRLDLTGWNRYPCGTPEAFYASIAQCNQLTYLSFQHKQMTSPVLSRLFATLPMLEELHLNFCESLDSFKCFSDKTHNLSFTLRGLHMMHCHNPRLETKELAHLIGYTKLVTLSILDAFCEPLDSWSKQRLARQLPNIKWFSFSHHSQVYIHNSSDEDESSDDDS